MDPLLILLFSIIHNPLLGTKKKKKKMKSRVQLSHLVKYIKYKI